MTCHESGATADGRQAPHARPAPTRRGSAARPAGQVRLIRRGRSAAVAHFVTACGPLAHLAVETAVCR
ncbi:hypothetical protein ACFXJM_31520 [Streptomyces massasporeus]